MRIHSPVGTASHRYRGGHGFDSRWSLRVQCNCLSYYIISLVLFNRSALIWSLYIQHVNWNLIGWKSCSSSEMHFIFHKPQPKSEKHKKYLGTNSSFASLIGTRRWWIKVDLYNWLNAAWVEHSTKDFINGWLQKCLRFFGLSGSCCSRYSQLTERLPLLKLLCLQNRRFLYQHWHLHPLRSSHAVGTETRPCILFSFDKYNFRAR